MDPRDPRARAIQESIRSVLLREWDPIGIRDERHAQDEYDAYIGGIYRLLASGASAAQLTDHLCGIQVNEMGLESDRRSMRLVAEALLRLEVGLDPTTRAT